MHVLRLAGAPGAGKSTVAWAVARELAERGEPTAYIDIDQLGMCYPEPGDDSGRWMLKERALVRVARLFAEAGAERLIVSGVAHPDLAPPQNGHPTTSVWLDADEGERRTRLGARGWGAEQADEVEATGSAEAARAHGAWIRVAAGGVSPEQTTQAGFGHLAAGPDAVASPAESEAAPFGGRVLWITGPRCAGASPAGWQTAMARWHRGERTGFIDAAQFGFLWNGDAQRAAAVAAVVAATFAEVGADMLIAVAPFEIEPAEVRSAFPHAQVVFARLDAADEVRRANALARVDGGGPLLAGDDLVGASAAVVDAIVALGARQRSASVRDGEIIVDAAAAASTLPELLRS